MDKIAEALRANLRELAQADARMLRELDGALPLMAQTEPRVRRTGGGARQAGGEGAEGPLQRAGLQGLHRPQ
jgi:hypothetical protein